MAFTLDKVVPWGRSYQEYVDMFSLTGGDLQHRILGCGDGPASFNAEHTNRGGAVVSFDPIYQFEADQIRARIGETYQTVITQLRQNSNNYVWDRISSIERLSEIHLSAMERFLGDFQKGKEEGRYIPGELPSLPFKADTFDLALSSHFLFLYSDHLTEEFHIHSLSEMLRVTDEARISPLMTLGSAVSPHLAPVQKHFEKHQFAVEIRNVAYEFQRGSTDDGEGFI
jgi:SAM-dependent methyltransferase